MFPKTENILTTLRYHADDIEASLKDGNTARALTHAITLEGVLRRWDEDKKREALVEAQRVEVVAHQATLRWLHEKEGLCAAMLAANPGLSPEDITLCQDTGLGGTFGIVRIWAEIKKRR